MAGGGEQLLGFGDVVRVCLAAGVVAAERRWNYAVGDGAAAGHDRAENGVDVDGVVESLSDANVGKWAARDVDGDVPEAQRRSGRKQLALFGICLPGFARFVRNRQYVDVARLELCGGGAHLGDDAR